MTLIEKPKHDQQRATRPLLTALLPILAILVALAAAMYGWQSGEASQLDVGAATDGAYIQNFYDAEHGDAGVTYRWGRDDPQVDLPAVRGPALLVLRMAGRPGGVAVRVTPSGQASAAFDVKGQEMRRYMLLWRGVVLDDSATIRIEAAADAIAPEKRRISVLLDTVQLMPLLNGLAILPPGLLGLFGLFGLATYMLPRLLGLHRFLALAVSIAASIGLTLAWSSTRIWVAPYMWSLTVGLVAIAAVLALVRVGAGQRLSDRELLLGMLACGAVLALYAGMADSMNRSKIGLALVAGLLALIGLRRSRLQAALTGLAVAATLLLALLHIQAVYADGVELRGNLHSLFRAAARLSYATLPLYNLTELRDNPFATTFNAPALVAVLMAPLTKMPLEYAAWLWRSLHLTLLLPAGLALLAASQIPMRSWAALGVLLTLLMAPTASAIADGQITPLLLLLAALALWALSTGRDLWFGVGIGAMAALSPVWALLLVYVLVQRRWRALPGAALGFVLLTLLAIMLAGWQNQQTYMLIMLPWAMTSTSWIENQSLAGLINRLFMVDRIAPEPGLGGTVQQAALGLGALLLLLTAWLTRRSAMSPALAFALWIVAVLLAVPTGWIYQHVLLALVFALALGRAYQRELGISWSSAACYMLAWMLIAYGDRWLFYNGQMLGPFWQLILSYKTYGLLLLYVAILLERREETGSRE